MTDPTKGSVVSLREITEETLRPILKLSVSSEQESFVAPNSVSIAEAHFAKDAWFRGIYADDTPVGFVMLSLQPEKPEYYLWRYMIDHRYQGLGFGHRAMEQVIDFVRRQPNAEELVLSYVRAEGGPRDFYARLGFVDTDEEHDGEWVMRLTL
ncbi:MAG TPA: GNAT family N-acetyltransferase [Acidimicrobiia bacterium]|nr:GNAT family N-acetyltransferase [Acidimicrobiia bacterium]